jgi:hypothetical protein
MQPIQPVPVSDLRSLALAQAADLAAAYDGDAPAAAHAGLRIAERQRDQAAIELWTAVCAIFEGDVEVGL